MIGYLDRITIFKERKDSGRQPLQVPADSWRLGSLN